MRRAMIAVCLTMIALGAVAAEEPLRLQGIAFAEGGADEIRIQVWAQGEQVADHTEWQLEPVFDGVVSPGKPFSVDLGEARLPVLVELAAEGHGDVALQVLFPEQLELPPAWLRRGDSLTISVPPLAGSSDEAVVWGGVFSDFTSNDPRHWRAAVAHRKVAPGSTVTALVPPAGFGGVLHGVHPQGHFGEARFQLASRASTARLDLSTLEVPLKVWDHRGRPVAGVRVVEAGSPFETAAVTDKEGRATVRVSADGQWKVIALDDLWMGSTAGRGQPQDELSIDLVPRKDVTLTWDGSVGPLALTAHWLPRALGGISTVFAGGQARLARVENDGWCTYWSPEVVSGRASFDGAMEAVALTTHPPVRLDGRVVTTEGAPVAGIPVWVRYDRRALSPYRGWMGTRGADQPLDRPWLPWAVSGPDGTFSVNGLPPSDLQAEALAPGLPTARGERLTGKEGQTLETTVVLRPGATLTLRVTDPEGAPLEAATVDVSRSRETKPPAGGGMKVARSNERGDRELSGTTDAEGRAVLHQVPVGLVRLRLSRSGSVTRAFDGIRVPEAGADLGDLVLEPGVTLRGTTVGPDGEVVANAEVALESDPRMLYFEPETTSDETGRFSIPDLAATGRVYLQARAEGFVPAAPLEVEMPPEGEVEVAMAEERRLEGVVLEARDDAPVGGAQLDLTAKMVMGSGGSVMTFMNQVGDATTDAAGHFVFDGLAGGSQLELTVSASGLQRVKRGITIPADVDPEPLVIRLERGLELRGRVLSADGEPAPGLRVVAAPASRTYAVGSFDVHSSTVSGADGRFILDGLGPGTLSVQARAEDGRSARTTAEAGQSEEVVLRFEPGLAIEGVVLDPEGAPVAGANVGAHGECIDSYGSYETSADGRFELQASRAGRCQAWVRAEGYAPKNQEIEVPEGGLQNLELRLVRGATVPGQVVSVSSSDLEGCSVRSDDGASTRPGADGAFRLSGVGAGERQITATLGMSDRTRTVRVSVPEVGESEPVTIDFASGLTLSGRVLRGEAGAPGLTVTASGVSTGTVGASVSNADGGWKIEGLEPGEYQLAARNRSGEVVAGDHVLLESDTELDLRIEAGRIFGHVVDADTDGPIEGATVSIDGGGIPPLARRISSDPSGFFEALDLADGDYVVRAEAPERSSAQRTVSVRDGMAGEVRLPLEGEKGTVFVVREPDGRFPSRLWMVSASGGALGPVVDVSCAAGGRCEVNQLPAGRWTIAIWTDSSAAALVVVDLPRDEVPVALNRTGILNVRAITDEAEGACQVRVIDAATGIVYPVHQWYNPGRGEWVPVGASGIRLSLPEGNWRLEVYEPDGTQSVRDVTVTAGGNSEVVLE